MDVESILDRRAAATAELEELQTAQGRAWLDDEPFDPALIDAKQAEIAAIDRAEAEQVRRDREALFAASAADRAEARREARRVAATQAAALTRIEESVKALAADLGVVRRNAKALSAMFARAGLRAPLTVETNGVFTPLSRLIASELAPLHGRNYFGDLEFPSVPTVADWKTFAATVANHLKPLIEGED